jgi:hypothetical protein
MLSRTNTPHAPWYVLRSDDKRRARLNCISHILKAIPYEKLSKKKVQLPVRSKKGAYRDIDVLRTINRVQEVY